MKEQTQIYELIDSYNEYLSKIPNGINQIVEFLRDGNIESAIELILQLTEGIQWLNDANLIFQRFGYSTQFEQEMLNGYLNSINEGLQIQDYILVADLLEYEIEPFFSNVKLMNIDA